MNGYLIDSSGWLEYFAAGKKANAYLKYLNSRKPLLTPSLILYEVYKKIVREKSEAEGLLAVAHIQEQSKAVIPLDEGLALLSADVSLRHNLAMADAIIYATALQHDLTLVTSDHHFEKLEHVILI